MGSYCQSMLTWEIAKPFFEWDGALRDLYAFNVSREHWQRFLDWVKCGAVPYSFTLEGSAADLPGNVDVVFDQHSVVLSLLPSFGPVCSHFFSDGEFELDLWPGHIKSQSDFRELLDLVERIAEAIRAPLSLTIENIPKIKLFTYDPASRTYHTFHRGPVWSPPEINESDISPMMQAMRRSKPPS